MNRDVRALSLLVARGSSFALPVLITSRAGYQNLCRLITTMKLAAPKGEGALTLGALDGRVGGLIALMIFVALTAAEPPWNTRAEVRIPLAPAQQSRIDLGVDP